jgi:hypothetical protein
MRMEENDPSNKSAKNTNKHSLKSLGGWNEFGTWRGFDSFELCLGVNVLALVLNENFRRLGYWSCGGWGVFIAPTTKWPLGMAAVDGRTRQSSVPPDTVRCVAMSPNR